jgi:hypothetical protein
MSRSSDDRFHEKFNEQIQFLARSSELFDRGYEDEALRLATTLRIVFHDTNNSTSLLTHLGLKHEKMLSSFRGHGNWQDYLAQDINLTSKEPIRMSTLLGDKFIPLSIDDWWNKQPVFVHAAKPYSRRIIILSAANKDGGAHVDTQLEEYYKVLCAGEYALGITGNLQYDGPAPFPQGVTIYPKNAHLALIRQFAHETICSIEHYGWAKKDRQEKS